MDTQTRNQIYDAISNAGYRVWKWANGFLTIGHAHSSNRFQISEDYAWKITKTLNKRGIGIG